MTQYTILFDYFSSEVEDDEFPVRFGPELMVSISENILRLVLRFRAPDEAEHEDDVVAPPRPDGPMPFSEQVSAYLDTRIRGSGELVGGQYSNTTCAVCLNEMCEKDEKIAVLHCQHEYHLHCIKPWLLRNNLCPLCKRQAIPNDDLDDDAAFIH